MHILIGQKPIGYCTSLPKNLDWVFLSACVLKDQFNRDYKPWSILYLTKIYLQMTKGD